MRGGDKYSLQEDGDRQAAACHLLLHSCYMALARWVFQDEPSPARLHWGRIDTDCEWREKLGVLGRKGRQCQDKITSSHLRLVAHTLGWLVRLMELAGLSSKEKATLASPTCDTNRNNHNNKH